MSENSVMVITAKNWTRLSPGRLMLSATLLCLLQTGWAESAPSPTTASEPVTIVGLRQHVTIGDDEHTEANMAALWQRFQALQALHYAVNWAVPVELFALYTGFDNPGGAIEVTVGYAENNLFTDPGDTSWTRQEVAIDQFEKRPASDKSTDNLSSTWQQLSGARLPVAILERYQLDPRGAVRQASILLKY